MYFLYILEKSISHLAVASQLHVNAEILMLNTLGTFPGILKCMFFFLFFFFVFFFFFIFH